jgi:hypothetical protein
MSSLRWIVLAVALVGLGVWSQLPGAAQEKNAPDAAALERTRAAVKMLDDMTKGYVVFVTATYVRAQEAVPAAHVAKKVYQYMGEKGHFTGRLLDASGKPFNQDNLAKSDFEKNAVAAIKGGKAYYDEVGTDKNGKHVLRAATIVPAVMKQCVVCHTNVKEGELLGVLTYELPIR